MAVNPAIAMGVQPLQLTDPLTQYGRFAAIQQAQNQNALAQYQLGAARREEASQNALNEAYRAAYDPQTGAVDMNRLRQTLATGGFGSKLPGIEKSMADMEEQRLKRDAAKTALADVKLKQARSFLDTIDPADPTAPEKFMAWHEANHRDPVLGPLLEARGVTADQSRGRIQQAIQQGPQAFAQLLLQSKVGTEKFMEMNKTPAPPVDVATMQALGFPLTPQGYAQYRDSQRQERMLSPEEEAQRIRIALASRPPPQPREPREPAVRTTKVELADGSIGVMNLDTGAITPATVGGQPAKGKPSAFAEKAAAQRKQLATDLDRTISELTEATKKGGLIDQATGSGIGRAVDVGAGFFGKATPGAIAIGKLAPIADMVLKMVPRFEGPQSDKDTKSYKEAAGQLADASMPNEIRKQAALEILRLMKARKGEFATADMAPETAAPARAPATGVDTSNPLLK